MEGANYSLGQMLAESRAAGAIMTLKPGSHVLLTSLSGQLGGMELRLAEEARFLQTRGHRVSIALSEFPESRTITSPLASEGIAVVPFDPPAFFEEWRWRRWKLIRARFGIPYLRRLHIDLAHIAYAWTQTGGSRLWLCHKANIPCVISVHNSFPPHRFTRWHARLMADAFSSVRAIYGVSQSALDRFVAIYAGFIRPATSLQVIHNFVDTDEFVPSDQTRMDVRKRLGIPLHAPLLGSIGRLDKQKDPYSVLAVFGKVHARMPASHLLFVGSGPLAQSVQETAGRLSLSRFVTFVPFRRDVAPYFAALDVHLLLSKQEGFGITSVEALASGVPVVATDVPGSHDVLCDCRSGRLIPYGDWDAAAAACLQLLGNTDELANIRAQARAYASARYSRNRWAHDLGQFYESLLSPRQSPGLN